jgi:glycosyltransferase involved in cell wall biosynthesis
MRALFVTGSLVHGGAERHSITLMNRLADRGHQCHAVYVKNDPSQFDRIRLRERGTVRCLEASRYMDTDAVRRFARHIADVSPSVIVCANPYALMYAVLARQACGARASIVVTWHSTRVLGAKEQLKMLAYRLFFLAADCAVFVCERQRRYWRRRALVSRRSEVIYNGVDVRHFSPAWNDAARAHARAKIGVAPEDFVIGLPAVLRPEKNPVQLVEAVASLRRQGVPAHALFIGDGEMRGAIEARARALGVPRRVSITGLQREVRPWLAACDAVALCSVTEAFSLAAIEAMALSKPVVHSDVGGAAEMIVPGWNGYLYPPGDARALAQRLALLARVGACERMGQGAREVVERFFTEERMVARYERTLLELSAHQKNGGIAHERL